MRTHDATAMGGGFPITDDDTFAVADSSDGGFSLRRIRVGDTDKDECQAYLNEFYRTT